LKSQFENTRIFHFHHRTLSSSSSFVYLQHLLPVLSVDEFVERVQNGNRWVRMRQLVLDVTALTKTHPGGRAVLDAGTVCDRRAIMGAN
jgi:hypothetical protein